MIKRIIKSVIAASIASVVLASSACTNEKREYTRIAGENVYFASEAETEKWRAPLEKLLSNTVGMEFYDDVNGELVREEPPYPERPSIEIGYGCALFDLTCDGTPELLVNMGGGSAGNTPYEVYDIFTGENIGSLDSSPDDAVCCYYDSEARGVKIINQYSWRNGWSTKLFFTSFITNDGGEGFAEELYLESRYEMEFEDIEKEDYDIVCKEMTCFIRGESAAPESYLFECESFAKNYIRIKETGLRYVSWHDVEEEGDTPDELGAKMAVALLSSGQRFVVYDEK